MKSIRMSLSLISCLLFVLQPIVAGAALNAKEDVRFKSITAQLKNALIQSESVKIAQESTLLAELIGELIDDANDKESAKIVVKTLAIEVSRLQTDELKDVEKSELEDRLKVVESTLAKQLAKRGRKSYLKYTLVGAVIGAVVGSVIITAITKGGNIQAIFSSSAESRGFGILVTIVSVLAGGVVGAPAGAATAYVANKNTREMFQELFADELNQQLLQ